MPVGSRARAPPSGLDAEQVVEQGHHEVVVQQPTVRGADPEREDRQACGRDRPEQLEVRVGPPGRQPFQPVPILQRCDQVEADRLLEGEGQAGPDRAHDVRGAALLAMFDVVQIGAAPGMDVAHRASARDGRHWVAQHVAAHREHPRTARAADELVRAEDHGVLVVQRVPARTGGHGDVDVRGGRRVVPTGQGAVRVQQGGDPGGVTEHPGDIARRAEGADPDRPGSVLVQQRIERLERDPTGPVQGDDDHVGERLAPRHLVGMVLVRPDEDHGAVLGRRAGPALGAESQGDPLSRGAQAEDSDQLVERARRPGSAEDHRGLVVPAHSAADQGPGLLPHRARVPTGRARLGVRVRVPAEHVLPYGVLHQVDRTTRCGVVGVGQPAFAERPDAGGRPADQPRSGSLQQFSSLDHRCILPTVPDTSGKPPRVIRPDSTPWP